MENSRGRYGCNFEAPTARDTDSGIIAKLQLHSAYECGGIIRRQAQAGGNENLQAETP